MPVSRRPKSDEVAAREWGTPLSYTVKTHLKRVSVKHRRSHGYGYTVARLHCSQKV